ncbi:hypothetical protein F1C10_03430 [Sphingomonas sp. NBWT7]|uniref:hypothetical protein n=1 Tax=Sphingomonas sp. NBWT7 TaxID=2596913 RepID=UPI001626D637|nr:hypothetical protein [Sphingomonas sp. NBWT7]QNE31090.1 hypothetical protein F1C10_03430 [Sphingomonas sp. NBWT7]
MNAFTPILALDRSGEGPLEVAEGGSVAVDDDDTPSGRTFGPLEWLVIAIGQRDGLSVAPSRPLLEAVGRLFGWHQPNQLANARLEELRRMAAAASEWGWHVPPVEMAAFLRAGWSEDQLEALIDRVAPVEGIGRCRLVDRIRP